MVRYVCVLRQCGLFCFSVYYSIWTMYVMYAGQDIHSYFRHYGLYVRKFRPFFPPEN